MALTELQIRDIARQVKEQGWTIEQARDVISKYETNFSPETSGGGMLWLSEPWIVEEIPKVVSPAKTTGIIPIKEAPIPEKSFLQKAWESLKEQVTTWLIWKWAERAISARESFKEPWVMSKIAWAWKTFESWLQILGWTVWETFNQWINAVNSFLKLDPIMKKQLNYISTLSKDKLWKIANNAKIQKLWETIWKWINLIPENLRADTEALINILPVKFATKSVSLTEKWAKKLSQEALSKAEKLSMEILKPWKYDEFAAKALVDNIQKAKTYWQLQSNLENTLKTTGKQLETELSKIWPVLKDTRIKWAIDFLINDLKANPALASLPARADKIKELEKLSKGMWWGGKNIKLTDVQKIKREIDDTFNLYSKSWDIKAWDAAKALAPERKYIKEFIEKHAPWVKELNTNYEWLREAVDLAKSKVRQFWNDASPDPTFFGRIRDSIPGIRRFETEQPSKLKIEASQLWKKTADIWKFVKLSKNTKSVQQLLKLPSVTLNKKLSPIKDIFKIK